MRKKSSVNTPFLLALGVIGFLVYYIWNKTQIDYDVRKQVYKSSADILIDGAKSDWEKLKSFWA